MSRPTYENAESLQNEIELINLVSKIWGGLSFKKVKKYNAIDYCITKNETQIVAFAELKCRKKGLNTFTNYSISLDKYRNMLRMKKEIGKPVLLIVWFEKKDILFYNVEQEITEHLIYWGGRFDRNDEFDAEPMIKINLKYFKPIK